MTQTDRTIRMGLYFPSCFQGQLMVSVKIILYISEIVLPLVLRETIHLSMDRIIFVFFATVDVVHKRVTVNLTTIFT